MNSKKKNTISIYFFRYPILKLWHLHIVLQSNHHNTAIKIMEAFIYCIYISCIFNFIYHHQKCIKLYINT